MDRILGQSRAMDTLCRQLGSGRLHHAYVFHGPAGVGKFTAAMAFARVLLCHDRVTDLTGRVTACGGCESCRAIPPEPPPEPPPEVFPRATDAGGSSPPEVSPAPPSAGGRKGITSGAGARGDEAAISSAHPDLHVITKELARYDDDRLIRDRKLRTIPVEVLRRGLIEPAHKSPQLAGGRFGKVFIIDEAELLNPAGQNALLKTLEEPPGNPSRASGGVSAGMGKTSGGAGETSSPDRSGTTSGSGRAEATSGGGRAEATSGGAGATSGGGVTIVLVTASEDRLLPTIRSRCQRVAFVPLDDAVVRGWVEDHGGGLSDGHRDWLVAFAGGSLGRAALAMAYGLTDWADTILPAMRQMASGRSVGDLGPQLAGMIGRFAEAWVKGHAGASKEAANQQGAALCFGVIATEARRGLVQAAAGCGPDDPVAGDALTGPWLAVLDAIDQAERYLGTNVNLGLACDHLALTINDALTGVGAA